MQTSFFSDVIKSLLFFISLFFVRSVISCFFSHRDHNFIFPAAEAVAWWFCGSLRAQQHAKTEARGDRVMQLILAAIADAKPLLKEGSRNMVVSCGVHGETRTAVALLPSPSLLLGW
ncbi:hypothetical protein SESBI_50229, partial [Sesbania bispinosa]